MKNVRLIENDLESGTMAVKVELENRTDYVVSSMDQEVRECGPIAISGCSGFVSLDTDGQVTQAYLLNGTKLDCGDVELTCPYADVTLKVFSVSDRTFHLDGKSSVTAIPGDYLLAGDTGFEIESATAEGITVRDYPAIECEEVRLLKSSRIEMRDKR